MNKTLRTFTKVALVAVLAVSPILTLTSAHAQVDPTGRGAILGQDCHRNPDFQGQYHMDCDACLIAACKNDYPNTDDYNQCMNAGIGYCI